ncbi:MAG: polysaccharide deacetylase family protein [Armatimonadota bacterium]
MAKVHFLRFSLLAAAILTITCIAVTPAAAGDAYIDDIVAAAVAMEQGNYDSAAVNINSAFTQRSGDPLVHIALGTMLLHTRQLDRAFKEFTAANELSPNHPLAMYGFGLYYLAYGKTDSARKYFEKASAGGVCDTGPALAYISAISGRNAEPSEHPVLQQIAAEKRFASGDYKVARDILSAMVKDWRGFEEEPGAVMTFDPKSAVAFTGKNLSKPYRTPSQAEPKLPVMSGTTILKADLSRTQGIAYVLFYVDDELLGMVNHSPYECQWDTTKYANSPHTIKIEGHSLVSTVVTDKSTRVMVSNTGPSLTAKVDPEEAMRAEKALWDCLKLKPSKRLAYYTLSKCADAGKDKKAATNALEHVVGIDPDYKDARELLISHYAPIAKYHEVWKAARKEKVAAITFDDGPSVSTPRLLKVLADKNVQATFFVVGAMAESNPDMLHQIAAGGHEIQIHTYSHRNLHYLSNIEIEKELVRTAAVVGDITGKSSRFFRPPGGHQNGNLATAAGKYGFSSVFWTVNCSRNEGTTPQNIIRQVSSQTVPGSIILMHNVEEVTLMALPKVIDALRAKGYKLVTFSELLSGG